MTEINIPFLYFRLSLKAVIPLTWAMSFIQISQIKNVSLFYQSVPFDLVCISHAYYISAVMVSVFETSVKDRAFEPRSGQIENYNIGICCFSAKHAVLMSKSKDSNPRSTTLEVNTLPITPPIYRTRG